ncbi:MAG: HAMP domain-containing protein [Rhizobiales bacterium]|nr:HAMP domain-containing protein [Hyphomicrobiales bacterium]
MAFDASSGSTIGRSRPIAGAGWVRMIAARMGAAFEALRHMRSQYGFKTLTGRILFLNLVVLIVLSASIYYFSKAEAWLITAKREALGSQAEIIAAAITQNRQAPDRSLIYEANLDTAVIERANEEPKDELAEFGFSIRPDEVAPVIQRLVKPTGTRARVYDANGTLVVDSDIVLSGKGIVGDALGAQDDGDTNVAPPSIWTSIRSLFRRNDLRIYRDIGRQNGKAYPEVGVALGGEPTTLMLTNEQGQYILSIATPIKDDGRVQGVLLLSTRDGDLDQLLAAEWWTVARILLLALAVIVAASVVLARTVGRPLRRLADSAERVRNNLRRREDIPDMSHRSDEIGHLAGTLREMTNSLYRRIEASDRFAADVAHELKNPLTSVRSAAESLGRVASEDDRKRLIGTIQADVKRLTRLIDDIANFSRLDRDLSLSELQPVDISKLLDTLAQMFADAAGKQGCHLAIQLSNPGGDANPFWMMAHDSRLAQVFSNLLSNALSFSPPGGTVTVRAVREARHVVVMVEDEGRGIPPENLETVFERFYTDRPEDQGFGNNSGLGLSLSREIVEAHGGRIFAENRPGIGAAASGGARFTVILPAPSAHRSQGARAGGRRN